MAKLREEWLNLASSRDVIFYLKYLSGCDSSGEVELSRKGLFYPKIKDFDNINIMRKELNDYEGKYLGDKYELVNHLARLRNINLIPMESFGWIEADKESCCFFWGLIKSNMIIDFANYKRMTFTTIDDDILKYNPCNHKERFLRIVEYFDSLLTEDNSYNKKELMEYIKRQWLLSCKDVKPLNWLDVNSSKCVLWCWNYLEGYDRDEREASSLVNGINSLSYFNPTNNEERFLAIYSVLKLWKCHHSEKKMLISNMSKAWHQRKLREERVGQKAINCYLDAEVKERLDKLARQRRCQLSEFLTELINEEYERVNKN